MVELALLQDLVEARLLEGVLFKDAEAGLFKGGAGLVEGVWLLVDAAVWLLVETKLLLGVWFLEEA